MTVATVNAVVSDVMLVTELHWLLSLEPLARIPGRSIELSSYPQSGDQNEDGAIYSNLRQRVGAVMKNLWHRRLD